MFKWTSILLTIIIFNGDFFFTRENKNSEWQLSKSKKQISVYTRHVNYSDYKEFKAAMNVKSNPEAIITLLRKINDYKIWLPDCLESKKLNNTNSTDQINYVLTDVPWPFEDRDIVYQFTVVETNSKSKQITILIENIPDYIPVKKNIVRIPKSAGFWTIIPISDNLTKVEYQMHVEPGGYVPAWLANLKLVDTPFTFLYNLREQIEKK
jgi:ribosome-associated toxin RatA of RatAB toxin-antitoxin module